MTNGERRRDPGTFGYLWCRTCKVRFLVAGRRQSRTATPSVEFVICPHCRAMRRMVLPPTIGAPIRIVEEGDQTRGGDDGS